MNRGACIIITIIIKTIFNKNAYLTIVNLP